MNAHRLTVDELDLLGDLLTGLMNDTRFSADERGLAEELAEAVNDHFAEACEA